MISTTVLLVFAVVSMAYLTAAVDLEASKSSKYSYGYNYGYNYGGYYNYSYGNYGYGSKSSGWGFWIEIILFAFFALGIGAFFVFKACVKSR